MSRAKRIDLDLIHQHFEVVAGELWKIDSRTKKPLIGEKTFIMNDDGTKDVYKVSRLIYAITNNAEEFDYLGTNDDGNLVPLPIDIISLLAHIDADKCWLHKSNTRGYTARLTALDGTRLSKTFNLYEDALKWQRKYVDIIWGERLKEYNVYNRYFDGIATRKYSDAPMPDAEPNVSRRTIWTSGELTMLKSMYSDGISLPEILGSINSEFGNERSYGGLQSRIHKLNSRGEMI